MSKDSSLALLKANQSKPMSGGNIVINKVNNRDFVCLLPPKSYKPANFKKYSDNSIIPPQESRPAGLPSIKYDYHINKSRIRNNSNASRNSDSSSQITNYQALGYIKRVDLAARQKIQQNLVNKAFGLPITPIIKLP